MPVPTNLSDLSTTAASNSPAATDTLSTTDDYLRAHASILAKIGDGTNALTTPALGTPASGTLTNCTIPLSKINGTTALTVPVANTTAGLTSLAVTALQSIRLNAGGTAFEAFTPGTGDFSSNTATSVDSEVVLFSGTGGKTGKRASTTGIAKLTSGVLSAAVSGTDYAPATSGTSILKGNGAGGTAEVVSGTDIKTVNSTSLLGSGDIAISSSLALLATLTPTAAAAVNFLTTFTSSYDDYLIVCDGILPATDDSLRMQFANAGSADTGSNYFRSNAFSAAVVTTGSASANLGQLVLAAGIGMNAAIWVRNANSTTKLKSICCDCELQQTASPGFLGTRLQTHYNPANAVSGGRLIWDGGANFAATGTVRIYGLKNS